jgi:curved DNA-binding protein CbpA
MKNRRNYYRILHVQPDAPMEVIKTSYRTLMLKLRHHPDLGGDHWNATLINEAYRVLADPVARAEYDRRFTYLHRPSTQRHSQDTSQEDCREGGASHSSPPPDPKNQCPFCHAGHPAGLREDPEAECRVCRSPLYETRRLKGQNNTKRSIARVKQHSLIVFYTHWPQRRGYRGTIRDLSPHGLQFTAAKPLSKNQVIKINSDTLEAIARIACCETLSDPAGHDLRIGAEFITLRFTHSRGTFVSEEV